MVFRIHFVMLAVIVLKAFNLVFEAEEKSYVKRTGSGHGWDVLFYVFSFLKGITLFTLIGLIGEGWSFLKPFLEDKGKKDLMIVIPLQVVANVAQVVIDEDGPYGQGWVTWRQVFLLVDVVCCCAVLFPIVWSIMNLRQVGWSFLKPFLQDKEKKVLRIVIPLQVVTNIAQVVIDEDGLYGQDWVTWKQVFLLLDVVCCCTVLFPIVWSIQNLREAARTDGKSAVNLMKLTLFRQYYIVVICYICFTRVVVHALETITSYRYLWTSVVAGELATLAFNFFTGYKFKPEAHNP